MPVGIGAISLQEVVNEIAGTQNSLQDCVDDHDPAGIDPTYGSAPITSLAEFRGYDDNPANLTISPTSTLRSGSSGSFTITVTATSGVSWTGSDNVAWITLSGASGTGNGSFTVNYTSNTGGSTRFGTVTVSWTGTNRVCSVSQQPI